LINFKKFFIFFAFFPELSIWVLPHDTQLMFPIIGLLGFVLISIKGKIKFDRLSLILLGFSILSIILVDYSVFNLSNLSFILMPAILFTNYVFLKDTIILISLRYIHTIVFIYLLGSLIQSAFPTFYYNLVHSIMYEVRWEISGEGGRGNNSFCIEPSHMAIIGVVLYFITKIIYKKYIADISNISNVYYISIVSSLVIIELLTKSVYSVLFFIFLFFDLIKFINKKSMIFLPLVLILVYFIFIIITNEDTRIGSFLIAALSNPIIFLSDPSIAFRLNSWFYSFYCLYDYPFGTLHFSYVNDLINSYFSSSVVNVIFPSETHSFLSSSMDNQMNGISSYFSRMGIFFWIIFLFINSYIFRKNTHVGIIFFFYLLNVTLVSAPIWILLILLSKEEKTILID
jgi:hypothetical protein